MVGGGRGGVDLCFSHSGAFLFFVLCRADASLHPLPHPLLLQRGSGVGLLLPRDPNHTKEREEEKKCLGTLGYLRLYTNTPPQFHMAQPNGIGKHLGDSRRDPKLDQKKNSIQGHHQFKTNKYITSQTNSESLSLLFKYSTN